MKLLQKLLPLFLLVAGACFFQSCKKEKTDTPNVGNSIVGRWNLTEWKGHIYQQGKLEYVLDVDIDDPVVWTFNADGTGIANNIDGSGNFKYEIISDSTMKAESNGKQDMFYYELSGTSLFIKTEKVKQINDGREEEVESHFWFKKL